MQKRTVLILSLPVLCLFAAAGVICILVRCRLDYLELIRSPGFSGSDLLLFGADYGINSLFCSVVGLASSVILARIGRKTPSAKALFPAAVFLIVLFSLSGILSVYVFFL